MSFKVGDRVEVLTPADGASYSSNNVGEGTVLSIEHGNYKVKVDSNAKAWFYRENQLRPLGTTEATPKPSIKVGDQVRLTGVVTAAYESGTVGVQVDGMAFGTISISDIDRLEVIRQPFKRGEVVWPTEGGEYDESWFLVSDEAEGKVLAVATDPEEYQHIVALDVDDYERRP